MVKNQNKTTISLFIAVAIISTAIYFITKSENTDSLARTKLNISWFVFRDENQNGLYDMEDRPYSGLQIELIRPDNKSFKTTSNLNGFANFKMAINEEHGVIVEPGFYKLVAKLPKHWEVTTRSNEIEIEFAKLKDSPASIVAKQVPKPIGVRPLPSITGKSVNSEFAFKAIDPGGSSQELDLDIDNKFHATGKSGTWKIIRTNLHTGNETFARVNLNYYPIVLSQYYFDNLDQPEKKRKVKIGYDELTDSGTVYKIPNGYRGLDWNNWIAAHSLYYNGSGYVNATVSSEYIAYNSSGHPGTISSKALFDFNGSYISVAWPKARKGPVHIEGYRNGELVYTDILNLTNRIPFYFKANYRDINELKIYSETYWQVILEDSEFSFSQK